MSAPILSIRDLNIALPPTADRPLAVEGLSLDVLPNEIVCIVGESGSGKTMAIRAVMGLLPVPRVRLSGGSIMLDGEDIARMAPQRLREIRGSSVAMIFQEPMTALNPLMTVGLQVDEMIRTHRDWPRSERRAECLSLFEKVRLPNPAEIYHAYPHQLSGGQRQRCIIAMALALRPRLLVADEPTTALDVTTQAKILSLIRDLQRESGTGVLFITHDFGVVAEIADRVGVMREGVLVEFGTREEVLSNPQHAYTRRLIAAVPSLSPRPRTKLTGGPVVLAVDGLSKSFNTGRRLFGRARQVDAVRQVSFEVHRGETLGIVGESGSGKTTTARCVMGLETTSGGRITIDGENIAGLSGAKLKPYRRRMQMIFQDPFESLNPRFRVDRIIAEAPLRFGAPRKEAFRKAAELLELVGLDPGAARRFPHEFSGGQRQRIGIARALAVEPEIVVADEPVSALDVSVQAQILELLDELRKRLDLTMIFITHDLRVAAAVCDRIAVMRHGQIVECAPAVDLFSDPQHDYTRELLLAVPGRDWMADGAGSFKQAKRQAVE